MRKWGIVIGIVIIIAVLGYNYLYHGHRDINQEQAEYVISTEDLLTEFSVDPETAEKKYLNKTIEITGTISELNKKNLTLNAMAYCGFSDMIPDHIKPNSKLHVKGRFIGYDDLLQQVKLDQCIIIN